MNLKSKRRLAWSKFFLIFIGLMGCATNQSRNSALHAKGELVYRDYCQTQIRTQPNGPFALRIDCDEAVGTQVRVLYFQRMKAARVGPWTLKNRSWIEQKWGNNVVSFVWGRRGQKLYISTTNLQPEGGLYELDLATQTSRRLFPRPRRTWPSGMLAMRLHDVNENSTALSFSWINRMDEIKEERETFPLPSR